MNRTMTMLCALLACWGAPLLAQSPPAPPAQRAAAPRRAPAADWWRDGVCYEVFVRSFQDSDGDGVGDFRGLTERLDYINDGDPATGDDLGATCIWLMPIMPSPSYHGYDVTNYYDINRDYGTLAEFRRFLDEAHARGIRVLIDLVLNHLSSEHPYFRDALLEADSPYRDWFIWSPTTRPAPGWSAPVWHRVPGRDEYYYGLFWSGMPDYDLAEPAVKAELERVARFWLEDVGVDGFRIDAVGHFFEGPNGEWKHGAGTHPWLREFSSAVRRFAPDAFTIGEVWDSIGAILPYYPDQLTAYFMFDVADAVVDAVRTGSSERLVTAVERVQREVPAGRWGIFLRNHDQTRTLTDLRGDAARVRLAAALQLTLPGLPFVYYGEEIGMTGSKSDGDPRLRTPMQWAPERGVGFTTGVPWEPLPADSFTKTVAAQRGDPASLLSHYRRLIRLRTATPALAAGDFVALETGHAGALGYLRRVEGQTVVVLANLTDRPLSGITLATPAGSLSEGRWAADALLGAGPDRPQLRTGADGRFRGWSPVRVLAPLETRILLLKPVSSP
ncbi:MAG TPA: alpha-amylase family glycosyl hydrolase [Longimicrobiales bacterium]|nr:alpha-amylase family glycosyl hydrolase [Longimicrobiales bacterium]